MAEVTIEPTPLVWHGNTMPDWDQVVRDAAIIGWTCWAPESHRKRLSRHFTEQVKDRDPILVWVPFVGVGGVLSCTAFVIDAYPTSEPESHWDVTVDLASLVEGEKPAITVRPSIHLRGFWHGWLTDGVLHQ